APLVAAGQVVADHHDLGPIQLPEQQAGQLLVRVLAHRLVIPTGTGQAPHGGIATGPGGTAGGSAIPGVSLVLARAAVLALAGVAASVLCAGVPAGRTVASALGPPHVCRV